jgi:general secretion pathway protein G
MKKKLRYNKGFSLIEILVVATIIGLLAAGAAISYGQFMKQSRDAKRKTDLEQVRAALEMYRSNNNNYPSGDWSSLGTALTGATKYIGRMPADPKSPTYSYYYTSGGTTYTLGSYLESTSTSNCTVTVSCTGANCIYCLGPYD